MMVTTVSFGATNITPVEGEMTELRLTVKEWLPSKDMSSLIMMSAQDNSFTAVPELKVTVTGELSKSKPPTEEKQQSYHQGDARCYTVVTNQPSCCR